MSNLLHVSSRRERRFSSVNSLCFFSFSSSALILFIIDLSISRKASSVSYLALFSEMMASDNLVNSS